MRVGNDGSEEGLEIKPAGIVMAEGERIIVETPGAGGYGSASERNTDDIAADRLSGKFSEEYLRECYGSVDRGNKRP